MIGAPSARTRKTREECDVKAECVAIAVEENSRQKVAVQKAREHGLAFFFRERAFAH
jgi:hypothetical protein